MTESAGPVLHLVGSITDAVFSFLGPATRALAERGVAQTVVLIDDPVNRHLLPQFHASVRLLLVEATGSATDDLRRLLDRYCEAARANHPAAAHLHGLRCSLLGLYAARFRGISVPSYVTPHGSRLMGPALGLGKALLWSFRPLSGRSAQRAIVNSGADHRVLRDITSRSIDLVESPIGEAFFEREPAANAPPLVIAGGSADNPLGAALFSQCAVLLADQAPDIRFAWFGSADDESVARLRAANVVLRLALGEPERARQMAVSRVFVAPAGGHGFPVFLTEAMAAGLPCVAWDTPHHRDVIAHDRTGFLCADIAEVIERVAALFESAELCQRIGQAARAEAKRRFDGGRFKDSLLGIYASAAHPH